MSLQAEETTAGTAEAAPAEEAAPFEGTDAPAGYSIIAGEHAGWAYLAEPPGDVADIEPGSILGAGFDAALKANRQGYDDERAWLRQWEAAARGRTLSGSRPIAITALPPAAEHPWQEHMAAELGPLSDPQPVTRAAEPAAAVPAEDSPAEKDSTEGETA